MKKGNKQRNQIKIIKNKEIIIYKNGKKFKHFKRSETKKLSENEMYILDYLLNKYMGYEVDISDNNESNENENIFNSNEEEFSQSNIKNKKLEKSYEDDIEENSKIKKKKYNQLYEEEEEDNNESSLIKSSKNKKNKKKENVNLSNEEEENEEEESYDSNLISNAKSKKNKNSKKLNESDSEGVEEQKIKKRIIKRYKNSNNKNTKKSITRIIHGDVVEIKDLKKSKNNQTQKTPTKANKKKEYNYYEENYENEKEEKNIYTKKENIPQYINELKSYTSPTIKFIDEQKAEEAILNGIQSSLFIKGEEKKGILILAKNNILCFISSDGDETDICLDNIKKIYFNVKGSANIKNYEKKTNEEKFIQLVTINNNINDFKFNNEEDFEFLIKGLIQIYKNKTMGVDKDVINNLVKKSAKKNINESERINKIKENINLINENNQLNDNNDNINNQNIKKVQNTYVNSEIIKSNESYNNNTNYNNNNNNNTNENENENENKNDDIIITTTITEVFKDGELINKETREKMDGVMKSLHVYSPDTDEYETFLRNTKLGQNQLIKRYNDGLPIDNNQIVNDNNDCNNIDNDNNVNEYEIKED